MFKDIQVQPYRGKQATTTQIELQKIHEAETDIVYVRNRVSGEVFTSSQRGVHICQKLLMYIVSEFLKWK